MTLSLTLFKPFRTPRVADRPLPPLQAYEAWWATAHPTAQGRAIAPTPRQYRRLAAMIRAGATGEEKGRAIGRAPGKIHLIAARIPEHLR